MKASYEKIPQPPNRSFFCWHRQEESFPFEWHFHPEIELTLIIAHTGQRFIDAVIEDYGPGDLALIGSNIPHTYRSHPLSSNSQIHQAIVVQFTEALLAPLWQQFSELKSIAELLKTAQQAVVFQSSPELTQAQAIIQSLPSSSPALQSSQFISLLTHLSQCPRRTLLTEPAVLKQNTQEQLRIEKVYTHLNLNFNRTISLDEVATIANMNSTAFCRFFKKLTQKTLIQYLTELRISHACRILIETDETVTSVCYQSGFEDLAHFNRQFKKLKTLSPGRYRKQFRAQ